MGHLESKEDTTDVMLPCTMIPNIDEVTNRYQRYKNTLCVGSMGYDQYKTLTSKIMMGKKGLVRSINSVNIDGSMKMVISPSPDSSSNEVLVPSSLCAHFIIPAVRDGKVVYERLVEGNSAILTRQPVLWLGGVRPVTVIPTEKMLVQAGEYEWDVNWSMRIPAQMCWSYGADFDGDEMTLFPVKDQKSIVECNSLIWRERSNSGEINDSEIHNMLIPNADMESSIPNSTGFAGTCLRATLCFSDCRRRRFKITNAHKACKLKLSSYLNFKMQPRSFSEFARQAKESTDISASKSSLQSEVGAISRRSKLGSERISISPTGCLQHMGSHGPSFSSPRTNLLQLERWSYGNPAVRGMSKLTARVMQITLKVKSVDSIEGLSPTLTMLHGSTTWPVVLRNGTVELHKFGQENCHDVEASPSLWEISRAGENQRLDLCVGCLTMCISETQVSLDPAEFDHIVQLLFHLTRNKLDFALGVTMETFGNNEDIPDLWRWSACYFDGMKKSPNTVVLKPQSLTERRFLGNFSTLAGISDSQTSTMSMIRRTRQMHL